ncbi:TonB-dependent receptor domain-containing protein [Sphingorhabdus sp.]|uniref:TonB-dependent receptor n=1 Tax=Sphingorhabdus sp. TaxID=1902408 RepID=UPI0035930ECB
MQLRYFLAASAAALSIASVVAVPAYAQQITSGIDGTVSDASGNAISNAAVTVTDTRTGSERVLTSDGSGGFRVGNLVTGGPYVVTVKADGFEGQTVENVSINLQGNTSFAFELASSDSGDVIVVSGSRANVSQRAVGPGTSYNLETLEGFPSITRDVRDIIRLDPRVSLDRDNEVDRISCLGGNDRGNTFTVDGVVQADVFGLNGTPFAARNALPLPFDVIRETSVEFAPFDVEYSDFTGCAVNVVTKSGQNKFHGSAFFTFTNEDLRGDTAGEAASIVAPFKEKRWGATLGGPIIQDRLFFYAGYEETDDADANEFGPAGAGFANSANFVTQAQFDRFAQIANDVYGQDTGGYPTSLPQSSVRYFGRLDAFITDGQRLEMTYQRLEENNVESDFGTSNLTGLNSFEAEGTISDYYSVRLYSDWTDRISTELRLSRAEVGDVQGPVGGGEAQSGSPIVRLAVAVPTVAGQTSQVGLLSTGPGIFRSANQLDTKVDQARFVMNLDADDHQIKIGAEYNDLEVFNLFAVNATGTLFFSSLDNFEQGILSDGSTTFANNAQVLSGASVGAEINATPTGDINEAAALFSRQIYSFFAQDDWQATDRLSVTAGVRIQLYDGDAPRANPTFLARYGFTNANPFSRIDPVILPRFSATYDFDDAGFFNRSKLTGGVGIFAGGDPVVYFSNAFSNNGFSTGFGALNNATCAAVNAPAGPVDVVVGGQFAGFPDCARQAGSDQAARGLADLQSTDPNFKNPTVLRANLGFETNLRDGEGFFSGWNLKLDYIYSKFRNTLNFVDLSQIPNPALGLSGFTVDGRPIYRAIDPTATGCTAQLQGTGGTPPVFTGVSAACFATSRDDEIQLTNGPSYSSHVASFALSKRFDRGMFTDGGSLNIALGYAFTDSNDARNNGSATATSSYDITAAFDRQAPDVSTALTESRHNFTLALNLKEQFFGEYDTSMGLFFSARSGRPYSLTFNNGAIFNDSASGVDNALLYIPTGITDPNISPTSNAAAVTSLLNYLDTTNCKFTPGQSIKRNSCVNDTVFDLDLRFSQELPGPGRLFGVEDKLELFADFDNFLNFIDSSENVFRRRGGSAGLVTLVDGGVDTQGRYIISNFNPDDDNSIGFSSSVWRIQLGVRYKF